MISLLPSLAEAGGTCRMKCCLLPPARLLQPCTGLVASLAQGCSARALSPPCTVYLQITWWKGRFTVPGHCPPVLTLNSGSHRQLYPCLINMISLMSNKYNTSWTQSRVQPVQFWKHSTPDPFWSCMIPPLHDHSHLNPVFTEATGKLCTPGLTFFALSSICGSNNSSVFDQKVSPNRLSP